MQHLFLLQVNYRIYRPEQRKALSSFNQVTFQVHILSIKNLLLDIAYFRNHTTLVQNVMAESFAYS